MDIATLIKEYRTKTGMTQQELADKVFVTRQTISKWELGKVNLIMFHWIYYLKR